MMELGKTATDELHSSPKRPFWQANMKIHLILVYWDARISISYNLVTPFKDGVTFAYTTATQSLQRCYLEIVADLTYVAVTNCHFWSKFLKFWIESAHTSGLEALGRPKRSKRRSQTWFYDTQTTKNHRIKKGLHSDLLHRLSSDFVFQPLEGRFLKLGRTY